MSVWFEVLLIVSFGGLRMKESRLKPVIFFLWSYVAMIIRSKGTCWGVPKRFGKANIPSKVQVFCWNLIHNRFPTIQQLAKHEIIYDNHNLVCPFCFEDEENDYHLFIVCKINTNIWSQVCFWLGFIYVGGSDSICQHFFEFWGMAESVLEAKIALLWGFVYWILWLSRSAILFEGDILVNFEISASIKRIV